MRPSQLAIPLSLAPTTGCSSSNDVGKIHRSPYSSDYYSIWTMIGLDRK
ncbi:MAG TPA: hypothetical protein VLS89_04975 [Candidatus Nanopelagicales bacterium]|nr:hypothetical protein [Candidatus Nanopelagicales bacterium]